MTERKLLPAEPTEEMLDAACDLDARSIAIAANKQRYPQVESFATAGDIFRLQYRAAYAAYQSGENDQGTPAPASVPTIDDILRLTDLASRWQQRAEKAESALEAAPASVPAVSELSVDQIRNIVQQEDDFLSDEAADRIARTIIALAATPTDPKASALEKDAARYRFILDDALGRFSEPGQQGDFTTVQPSGYNGGDHVWIEFGFKHPKWQAFNKADVDAAIDAAIASTSGESGHD